MNTIIFYAKIILGYIIRNKSSLYSAYKEIKKDGKVNFKDIVQVASLFEQNGVILEENDNIFVGAITQLKGNKSKNLVQYTQAPYSCALDSFLRVIMYNTDITYTIAERDAIYKLAVDKGYLNLDTSKGYRGMTVSDAQKVILQWTLKHKGRKLKYDKVKFGSAEDKKRKELGYSHTVGGSITGKYISDFRGDGIVDETYTWDEKKLYGHLFSYEPDGYCTENYPKQFGDNNRYINKQFPDFIKNGYFFSWSYYIMSDDEIIEDTVEEMKEQLFIDVYEGTDYYEAIKWAKENGIVKGYSNGELRPDENLTVGRMLQILKNMSK